MFHSLSPCGEGSLHRPPGSGGHAGFRVQFAQGTETSESAYGVNWKKQNAIHKSQIMFQGPNLGISKQPVWYLFVICYLLFGASSYNKLVNKQTSNDKSQIIFNIQILEAPK